MIRSYRRLLAAGLSLLTLLSAASCAENAGGTERGTDAVTQGGTDIGNGGITLCADPVNGSDDGDGTEAHPVSTLKKAKELAAAAADGGSDVKVVLRGGTYLLDGTLTFGPEDGGRNGHTVTWIAAEGEEAEISGGYPVKGWTLHDAEKGIYAADVKGYLAGAGTDFVSRDFFVGRKRAVLARTAEDLHSASFDRETLTTSLPIAKDLARPQDAVLVIRNMWSESRVRVKSAETSGKGTVFTMVQPAWKTYNETASLGGAAINANQFAFLENAYEFLDEPGEWYLDPEAGKLYYLPRDGEDLTKTDAVLGSLEEMIVIRGTAKEPVRGLVFENLSFRYSTWLRPETDDGLLTIQGNVHKDRSMTADTLFDNTKWLMPEAAVSGAFAEGLVFRSCTFECLGSTGLFLSEGIKKSAIERNIFRDTAGSGIMLGGFTAEYHDAIAKDAASFEKNRDRLTEKVSVTDNKITGVASVYSSGCGIIVGYVRDTDVSHNTLSGLPYTGISFGWGWGFNGQEMNGTYYTEEDGGFVFRDNTICCNRISDIMNVMFDGGGIYVLGRNDGTEISGNYIEEVRNDYGGIYLDNGAQGITVSENVLTDCYRNYIYKGDFNEIYLNYAKEAKAPDMPMLEPLEPSSPKYVFKDNYLEDEEEEGRIYAESGVRSK